MTATPLIYLDLLADTHLRPGAWTLDAAEGNTDALHELLLTIDANRLSKRLPAFRTIALETRLSSESANALDAIGIKPMQKRRVVHCDAPAQPASPPDIQWYSGNWYLSPPARLTAAQTASQALALKLVGLVAADADTHDLEAVFRQDPVLAYNLLRFVNSIGAGAGRHISSFSEAILILGRQQLKRWINLLLFASNRGDNRAHMLLASVAVRARSMELLARQTGHGSAMQEQAFMAGMFSQIGTLLGQPLAKAIEPLRLHETINAALLAQQGELGHLLKIVAHAERSAESSVLAASLEEIKLTLPQFAQIRAEAFLWMLDILHE